MQGTIRWHKSVSEFSWVVEPSIVLGLDVGLISSLAPSALILLLGNNLTLVFNWYDDLACFFLLFKDFDSITFWLVWMGEPLAQVQGSLSIEIVFSDIFIIDLNLQICGISIEQKSLVPFGGLSSSAMRFCLELLISDGNDAVGVLY